ncbi:MAG: peptidoglycan-binding protein [Patescibacteria group bacterium]
MKKTSTLIFVFAVGALLVAGPVFAQTATPNISDLLKQIAELQEKINILKAQQATVVKDLVTTLKEGDRGPAVEELQAILRAEGVFNFPRITGVFGPITREAVKSFQLKHGISPVGNAGPQTMAKIKEKYAVNASETPVVAIEPDETGGKKACLPPGHLISPGQAKKGLPNLPPCKSPLPPGILKLLGQGGPHGTSSTSTPPTPPPPPDTTPPVISGLTATSTTASTTNIIWSTNESATSKVWYSITSGFSTTTAAMVSDGTLVVSHNLPIIGLTASTTYYYRAYSADAAGNPTTSAEQQLITLP